MKRYKLTALILALILALTACKDGKTQPTPPPTVAPTPTATSAPAPTPAPLTFTRENFPRLDGSTATVPLGKAVAARMLGESEESVADLIQFSKTSQSYNSLIWGNADLLISAAPDQDALDEKERQNFRWEMEPFANDAFVFLVNEHNPVDSLTTAQIRDIYTGKITNWKEVGGADLPIVPFQRNPGAGSQTLMENLVMKGEPMMEAPVDYVVGEMGGLMDAVRSFDGTASAIGYSVYYYAAEMKMAGGLKLLKVEGVAPEAETIRAGKYPLLSPYYAVIRADAAPNTPARKLFDWLLSDEGQSLVGETGYVAVKDVAAQAPGLPTYVEEKETRWYPEETDTLIPRKEGYGQLIPFNGARTDLPSWGTFHYRAGLMTADGVVVVDPVLFGAGLMNYFDAGGQEQTLPLLLLTQAVRESKVLGSDYQDAGETYSYGAFRYAIAEAEGKWCTGFDYTEVYGAPEGILLVNGEGLSLMELDGAIGKRWSWSELGYDEAPEVLRYSDEGNPWSDGMVRLNSRVEGEVWYRRYLDTESGAIIELADESMWSTWSDGLHCAGSGDGTGYAYYNRQGKQVLSGYSYATDFVGGTAIVRVGQDRNQLIDKKGKVLLEARSDSGQLSRYTDGAGGWWYLATSYDAQGQVVLGAWDGALQPLAEPAQGAYIRDVYDGWVCSVEFDPMRFYRGGTVAALTLPDPDILGWMCDSVRDGLALLRTDGNSWAVYRLSDGAQVVPIGTYEQARVYLYGDGEEGKSSELMGGLRQVITDTSVQVFAQDGTLLYAKNYYPDSWGD